MTGTAGLRVLGVMAAAALLVPAGRAMAQHGHGSGHHGGYHDGSQGYGEHSRGDHYSSPRTQGRYAFDGHENGYRYHPRHRSHHARHGDYDSPTRTRPRTPATRAGRCTVGSTRGRTRARTATVAATTTAPTERERRICAPDCRGFELSVLLQPGQKQCTSRFWILRITVLLPPRARSTSSSSMTSRLCGRSSPTSSRARGSAWTLRATGGRRCRRSPHICRTSSSWTS